MVFSIEPNGLGSLVGLRLNAAGVTSTLRIGKLANRKDAKSRTVSQVQEATVAVGALIVAAGVAAAVGLGIRTWYRASSDGGSPSADAPEVRPDAVKTPVSAEAWQPLQEALETHVRLPLKQDPSSNAEWQQAGDYPYPQGRGQVFATDDRLAALSYTLSYACMHFDALCTLLDKTEFRVPVSAALADGNDSSVLHIDCGCGPGTASWAVMNVLSGGARVTTIGHDHNAHMIGLADLMTADVAQAMTKTCHAEFCQDWDGFVRRVVAHCEHRWRIVIVTANSLFGQNAMRAADIRAIVELIIGIRQRPRESPVFLAGTHPRYSEEHVNNAWDDIVRSTGADRLYSDRLENIVSGNPRRYDAPSWVPWRPPAQLAHLFCIAGAGENP